MRRIPVSLVFDFAWRDIQAKHRNTVLGLAWLILAPLAMLTIYTLVFSGILGLHLSNDHKGMSDYALNLAAGMIVYFFFSGVVSESPLIISTHANYVKKMVFPLPVFVWAKILTELATLLVSVLILVAFLWLKNKSLPSTAWLVPLILLPCVIFTTGSAFVFSALGVYLPDIRDVLKPSLQVMFYFAPVLYPLTVVPEAYRGWFWSNPITSMVQPIREVLVAGQQPDWTAFLIFTACSLLALTAGTWFFHKTRYGFADVL